MAKDSLTALADAVASDAAVDWLDAESSAVDAAELAAIRQLRAIAALSSAARTLTPRWGPFELRGEIGRGAFGTVYRAWDPRLGREVALKLLHASPDTLDTGGVIAEARMLAGVEHPNIVPVYGADVHDGRVGIWMKLVNGKTLKEILVEQGPFGAEEAAQIGRALCRALAAVHRKGFVHRDIKAQNVMREVGGEILLMDFGAGDVITDGPATALRGSPAYLAPEVLAGGPPTVQSDIYSLGVLLFHLVSGAFPVPVVELRAALAGSSPQSPRSLGDERPGLPQQFVSAVDRCLSSDPLQRPATAGSVGSLLGNPQGHSRRKWRGALWRSMASVLALAGITAGWAHYPWKAQDPPTILIMPLRNTSGDPEKDYFAAALTHEIATRVWKLGVETIVTPVVNEASDPRQSDREVTRVSSSLGVDRVLTGSISWLGGRVRLTVSLVEASSGRSLWGESYDREVDDILEVQRSLAEQLARALGSTVGARAQRTADAAHVGFEPYQLYLRGRYLLSQRTPASIAEAIGVLEATTRQVDFAPAYAALANAYSLRWGMGILPAEEAQMREKARSAAEHALALDPQSAEAHLALAFLSWTALDWTRATESFQMALTLGPSDASAHHWYAMFLTCQERMTEAIRHASLAQRLEPTNMRINSFVGWVYYQARDYGRAEAQLKASLAAEPNLPSAHSTLAVVYSLQGRHRQALDEAEAAVRASRNDPEFVSTQALVLARAGDQHGARALLEGLLASPQQVMAGSIAVIYAALHDQDRALEYLERSLEDRDIWAAHMLVEPRLDPVRDTKRFAELLRLQRRGGNKP